MKIKPWDIPCLKCSSATLGLGSNPTVGEDPLLNCRYLKWNGHPKIDPSTKDKNKKLCLNS